MIGDLRSSGSGIVISTLHTPNTPLTYLAQSLYFTTHTPNSHPIPSPDPHLTLAQSLLHPSTCPAHSRVILGCCSESCSCAISGLPPAGNDGLWVESPCNQLLRLLEQLCRQDHHRRCAIADLSILHFGYVWRDEGGGGVGRQGDPG